MGLTAICDDETLEFIVDCLYVQIDAFYDDPIGYLDLRSDEPTPKIQEQIYKFIKYCEVFHIYYWAYVESEINENSRKKINAMLMRPNVSSNEASVGPKMWHNASTAELIEELYARISSCPPTMGTVNG